MRKYIAIIIASLALFTGQAHAQRCLPKMQGIEVRADMADGFNLGGKDGGYSFGAALSTYTKKGNKWVFGGEYLLKNNPYKDTKIPVAQFTAEGGYYFKILSDARKIVFVYAGASALAGYEAVNWGKKLLFFLLSTKLPPTMGCISSRRCALPMLLRPPALKTTTHI